ncbi:MAG: NUDIX hydrolase [Magnetococcus sp. DMHC-1]|nr:NUDIX hydrolase [Magnetococcales bacterium]
MIIRPGGLLVHDGRLLLMRYEYGGQDRFNLPGGKPDPGEDWRQCLIREWAEELNLTVQPGKLIFLVESEGGGRNVLHPLFQLTGTNPPKPRLNPHQTSALEVLWLNSNTLRQAILYPHIPHVLSEWLEGKSGSDPYLGRILQPWS